MGHGRFYAMKGANLNDPNPEKIEALPRGVYNKLGLSLQSPGYSWWCMGLKGLVIGGVPACLAWPFAYAVSFKLTNDSEQAEYTTGGFAGFDIAVKIILLGGLASLASLV
jgi:hypothetical protein